MSARAASRAEADAQAESPESVQPDGRLREEPAATVDPSAPLTIEQLAKLDLVAYDRQREKAAESLGIRVSTLDAEVARRRPATVSADDRELFPVVEPWSLPVDGARLLMRIGALIKEHVVADRATVVAAALWIVHTYLLDVLTVSPIAHISAPAKRCGKTVLLSVLGKLVARALQVSNVSVAAMFRAVEKWQPTLLIDEADSFLAAGNELRGILNAGHERQGAYVLRCVGDDHEPKKFSTWAAKAIAGIGKIAGTLEDRSIPLTLRRKLPGEKTANLRHADEVVFAELRAKLQRWSIDNAASIGNARPESLPTLNDRAAGNWAPLLAIADAAGGLWPKLAREAATQLSGGHDDDDDGAGDELLAAIREVFDAKGTDRLPSAVLIEVLVADSEAAWATCNRGKPITPRLVARKLGDYKIRPTTFRLPNGTTPKGYVRSDFEDAWHRYLPAATPHLSATTQQRRQDAGSSHFQSETQDDPVADQKARKPAPVLDCCVVADKTPPTDEGMGSARVEGEL